MVGFFIVIEIIKFNKEILTHFFHSNHILVSDLNIVETLNQVKAKLQSENIPQNALTRALYNDRIGRMFYNRSKQFQRCNEQTRDCILRAFMWLHDPDGIKKLKDYMNGKYSEFALFDKN